MKIENYEKNQNKTKTAKRKTVTAEFYKLCGRHSLAGIFGIILLMEKLQKWKNQQLTKI